MRQLTNRRSDQRPVPRAQGQAGGASATSQANALPARDEAAAPPDAHEELRCTHLAAVQNAGPGPSLGVHLDDAGQGIGMHQAQALLEVLQQPGMRLSTLHLNLREDIDAEVLKQLLGLVAAHPELNDLRLLVNGTDLQPPGDTMRCTIARAAGCLRFPQVRRLLFNGLQQRLPAFGVGMSESAQYMRGKALSEFIALSEPVKSDAFAWPHQVNELTSLAILAGDEALLIAIAAAAPGQQIAFKHCPDALTCQMLERSGLAYRLELNLFLAEDARKLCAWLEAAERPMLRAIVLERVCGFNDKSWTALLKGLMRHAQAGSLQAVMLTLFDGDTLEHDSDPSLGFAALQTLAIHDHSLSGKPLAAAVQAIERLRPRYLSLYGRSLAHCSAIFTSVSPVRGPRLQGVFVGASSASNDREESVRLTELFVAFQGPGFISVYLPKPGLLSQAEWTAGLKQGAVSNPLLDGVSWHSGMVARMKKDPPYWRIVEESPKADRTHLGHWLSPLQLSRWRHGAEHAVTQHLSLTVDIGVYLVKVGELSPADLRALASVSPSARLRGQAVALAHAMNSRPPLSVQALRTLLRTPTGEVDAALESELYGVLDDMKPGAWVWPLFEAATRPG